MTIFLSRYATNVSINKTKWIDNELKNEDILFSGVVRARQAVWLNAVSGQGTAVGQTARGGTQAGQTLPNLDAVSKAAQAAGETVE